MIAKFCSRLVQSITDLRDELGFTPRGTYAKHICISVVPSLMQVGHNFFYTSRWILTRLIVPHFEVLVDSHSRH